MPVIILYYNVFNPVLILIIFATIVILTIGLLIILTIVNINPMISSTMWSICVATVSTKANTILDIPFISITTLLAYHDPYRALPNI
jgi:hypothetical protein